MSINLGLPPVQAGDVVFLGDSITAGGDWQKAFPDIPTCNHGINGDTSGGVLQRLKAITDYKPSKIFLKIGTNDLALEISIETILDNYRQILNEIKSDTPATMVYAQSVLPRALSFRRRIESLNDGIKELSLSLNYSFLNLYPAFQDPTGALRAEFTDDDLHLSPAGYRHWETILKEYLYET